MGDPVNWLGTAVNILECLTKYCCVFLKINPLSSSICVRLYLSKRTGDYWYDFTLFTNSNRSPQETKAPFTLPLAIPKSGFLAIAVLTKEMGYLPIP